MPTASVIAAALTNHAARAKSLWIDGLDVLLEPGQTGMPYGCPIETIEVTEAGPGGVSSLNFDIIDLASEVVMAEGQLVRFWDHTLDAPLFLGFIQSWAYQP